MVTNEEFSKVFGCSIEDVDKFCYDFFSAEDILTSVLELTL